MRPTKIAGKIELKSPASDNSSGPASISNQFLYIEQVINSLKTDISF